MVSDKNQELNTKIVDYLLSLGEFKIADIKEKVFSFSSDKNQILSILSSLLESNLFSYNFAAKYYCVSKI